MKIMHFLTSINTGGAEKFCVDICNTQAAISENDVYLCVLDSIADNQPLVKMISPEVTLISFHKKSGYSIKIIYKIYQLLSQVKPDVIHFNGRCLVYASLPVVIKKIPSIYTVHTMANKQYGKYLRSYIKFIFNWFPAIFTPVSISRSVGDTVKKIYGNSFNTVIFNGSSELTLSSELDAVECMIDRLKKDVQTLVFVSIGRIAKEKNTLLLVKVFNKLLDDGQNVCLCIIGYDGMKSQSYLNECIKENRHLERINFVGRKENIADYLYYADALCLTSTYEGLGIAALEAFSMGVPVVSTPSGGPSDIIVPGLNGYISKQITVESYAEEINKFIKKPLLDKPSIVNLYKEKYTMKACALQYLELYKEKIENRDNCL
jgi:glycosyltransferase involved in cell wall biosynthesis